MDSVNNLPDTQAKSSNAALNFLSFLSATGHADLSVGDIGSLFANFLSQNQNSVSTTQSSTKTQASSTSQSSAQNNVTGSNASASANASATGKASVSGNGPVAGWAAIGKFLRHDMKLGGQKDKAPKTSDDTSNQTPVLSTNSSQNTPAPAPSPSANASVTANVSSTTNSNSQTPSTSDDATSTVTADATVDPSVAPAQDPTVDPATSAPVAALNNAVQFTLAQNIVPPSNNAPATDVTQSQDSQNTPSTGGHNDLSQLLLLLSEFEHSTAERLANQIAPVANNAPTDPTQTSGAVTSTTSANTVTQSNNNLADLLAALSQMGGFSNSSADTQNSSSSLLPDTASTATVITPQTNDGKSAASNSSNTSGNLSISNFLNLFNPVPANTDVNTSLMANFASGAASMAAANMSDNASLGAETQSQSDASLHNGGTNASAGGSNALSSTAGALPPANPYDFASQLSALRAAKGGPTGLPTPVEQVILQMGRATKDGASQMTIQLRPAELGRIDVKLSFDGEGKMQGTVTADNPATLGLLLKDVRSLERALQEAGLRADPGSLQFNLRGDGQPGGSSGQMAGDFGGGQGGASLNESAAMTAFADPVETYYLTPGGVNIRV